ncbi:hypothetical protein A5662_14920 [Mycobacteriaceae bacterium 1482268.1]|nr:hypothetical protein A5662_14920 [Mycobacteriaceae bacterium 1482268.1]
MTVVAGIDSSAQPCKVVVCDADSGEIVRSGTAPHPGSTAVDPLLWWQYRRNQPLTVGQS